MTHATARRQTCPERPRRLVPDFAKSGMILARTVRAADGSSSRGRGRGERRITGYARLPPFHTRSRCPSSLIACQLDSRGRSTAEVPRASPETDPGLREVRDQSCRDCPAGSLRIRTGTSARERRGFGPGPPVLRSRPPGCAHGTYGCPGAEVVRTPTEVIPDFAKSGIIPAPISPQATMPTRAQGAAPA